MLKLGNRIPAHGLEPEGEAWGKTASTIVLKDAKARFVGCSSEAVEEEEEEEEVLLTHGFLAKGYVSKVVIAVARKFDGSVLYVLHTIMDD